MDSLMVRQGVPIMEWLIETYEEKLEKKEDAFLVISPKHLWYVLRGLEQSENDTSARRLLDIYRLSLTQRSLESSESANISFEKFRNLTQLDLRKIKISKLSLSSVKTQLLGLYCDGCDFEETLDGPLNWSLESLAFKNRSWKPLKLDFLNHMPWLVELNLSHNNLNSCNLESLKLLIHVNLNFNHLTEIPKLAEGNKVRTLLLSHNFITNLSGLDNLGLNYLDLSFNIITIPQLDSISSLKELQHIYLDNNPCSVQLEKKFRVFMAYKIRSKHSTVKLDDEEISEAEKYRSRQRDQIDFFNRLSEKRERLKPKTTLEISEDVQIEEPPLIVVMPKKTKEAIIGSSENESPYFKSQNKTKKKSPRLKPPETMIESIIESNLPEKYPISYSSSPDDNFVQATVTAILHAPSTSKQYQETSENEKPQDITGDEFYDASHSDMIDILNNISVNDPEVTYNEENTNISTLNEDGEPKIEDGRSSMSDSSINSVQETSQEKTELKDDELTSIDESKTSEFQSEFIEDNDRLNQDDDSRQEVQTSISKESDDESDHASEEIWWHVKLYEKDTQKTKNVCIALLEKSLKEYNPSTGAVRRKWPLKYVQGCVKTKTDPITLEIDFESPNSGKEQVCYIMEYADSQHLMKTLYGILESKNVQKCKNCANSFEMSENQICSVCGSFGDKISRGSKSISQSPSESSIALDTNDKNQISLDKKDIYSFVNFDVVDERVKYFLYKDVFNNENEKIIALVKCHLWKTGGSDYDGCFVFSNSSVYTLYHSRTDFSDPVCDWLSKADSYRLGDIKQISPLIHNQGVEIKINNIVYFLLLMDSVHTESLMSFLKDLKFEKLKIYDSFNPKLAQNLALQQAISGCELVRSAVDPTVDSFTIFKSIEIIKDKENEEIMRLGGIVVTSGEFYILPGDLSWMANSKPPQVHSYQEISRLIEVRRNKLNSLSLYFLDEQEASEEVWTLTLTPAQIYTIIKSIEGPWEKLYSVPLEITINYF